jgi:hypothetical protein
MYCPYCGSQLWIAEGGEARCPSGAAFSVAATRSLDNLAIGGPKPVDALTLTKWFCPTHGFRMVSSEEVPTCVECGRTFEISLLRELIELNSHQPWPPKAPARGPLFTYWITRAGVGHPIGVSADSFEDALSIVRRAGYELPDSYTVIDNVRPADLDPKHVLPNSGPLVVRGVWYPLTRIGEGA